jgi:drug/metabolite transporter (DMT)-like permease
MILALKRGRDVPACIQREFKPGLLAGVASLITYSTALIALRLIPVGSAAALRVTSVVFGAIIAARFLNEGVTRRRTAGIMQLASGGAAVALWN